MVRPVSFKGFQKGFQGVSLRGFRGFQIFLWELCVCIKYLSLGDADAAAGYFLSALNYASPLITWPEERGKEAGSTRVSGDRQHVWTLSMICHYLHDSITRDRGGVLQLLEGIPRDWLAAGESIAAENIHTTHGRMNLRVDRPDSERLELTSFDPDRLGEICLHLRLPDQGLAPVACTAEGATVEIAPDRIFLHPTASAITLKVQLGRK